MPHFDAQRFIAVGNIVRKEEIACNKQFPLFSQYFLPYMVHIFHYKKMSAIRFYLDQSKILSSAGNGLTHSHTMTPFDTPGKQAI